MGPEAPITYIQDDPPERATPMSEKTRARAEKRFHQVRGGAVLYNRDTKKLVLVKTPETGWWFFEADAKAFEDSDRSIVQEENIRRDPYRSVRRDPYVYHRVAARAASKSGIAYFRNVADLKYVSGNRYIRAEGSDKKPIASFVHLFAYGVSRREARALKSHLAKEQKADGLKGVEIKEFSRRELVRDGMHQSLIDAYDDIFGSPHALRSPKTYDHFPDVQLKAERLTDTEMGAALGETQVLFSDVVPMNIARRTFYLVKRKARPTSGWWWFGGTLDPYKHREREGSMEKSVADVFKRETKLILDSRRLKLLNSMHYIFPDRAQEPQDAGSDTTGYVFGAELTPEEIEQMKGGLDEAEYEGGVTEMTYEDMVKNGVPLVIRDTWMKTFGPGGIYGPQKSNSFFSNFALFRGRLFTTTS
ncbi:MAG: hypothetical protein AAB573_01945 [Patescibacteria group bacterium]